MRIKKINIHGFKSFVDKVEFSFPPGTSAIVGPNGCGKSNVVDAIRWVLGEHNARHLRGKLMEDLIFNGSTSRKSLGMAEVTLTLSNEGGLVPSRYADYSEIEVQRRLFRSGDSEYSINKVPCRLKDIVEFFTDTGLGTNAYSIIEQGQVGWLINAKATERRILIEEAAGINKYKQKKDASMRRLDSTKLNLTRVTDIIGEVKRQLNSLNRQAKKAERYKKFKDELKDFDLYLANAENKEMSEKKGQAEKNLHILNDNELKINASIDSLDSRIETLRVEHLKKEDEYSEVREKAEEIESQIIARERDSELLTVRTGEIQRNEERLAFEISELKTKLSALSEECKSLLLEQEKVLAALMGIDERLTKKEEELDGFTREMRYKTELLNEEEAAAITLSTKLTEIKHSLLTCARDEEVIKEQEGTLLLSKENVLRDLSEKEASLNSLRESILESEKNRAGIQNNIEEGTELIKRLDDENTKFDSTLIELKEEWALKSSKLHTLEEIETNMDGLDKGVKELIEAGRSGDRKGILGLVADLIEPDEGFERAVEAVLGERLNSVVVEDPESALEAIGYLKESTHGHGSFLPKSNSRITKLNAQRAKQNAGSTGGLTRLREKVTVKDGYGHIIDYLLSDAVIANDLKNAKEVSASSALEQIFVTKEGEMIGKEGSITGGYLNESSIQDGGILQKRRRIADFKERVEELEGLISTTQSSIDRNKEKFSEAKGALENSQKKLHERDLTTVNLSSDLKISEEKTARLKAREDELTSLITEANTQLEELAETNRTLNEENSSFESELNVKEESVTTLKKDAASLSEHRESMADLILDMKVERASLQEREESLKSLLEDKDNSILENENRIEEKELEIEGGRVEKEMAHGRVEELKVMLEDLLERKGSIKGLEVRGREVIGSMNEKIESFEKELRTERAKLSNVQGSKGEASIELKELELALENLGERIIEKYAISIERYENTFEEFQDMDRVQIEERATELRTKIASLGEVSLSALDEFTELEERYSFLCEQRDDLTNSVESLLKAITKINKTTKERFRKAFNEINEKFQETFPKFFNGGKAELILSDPDNILETGVEISAQPPGKKLQNIMLLSGGEKALTATALIFAIFLIKPSPFCLLDEVDAPLDDANIERFNNFVSEMSEISQFVLITHNKRTMEVADTLYGITMEEPGVSKAVSVQF